MSHTRIGIIAVATATVGMVWLSAQSDAPKAVRGFSASATAGELAREAELKALPSPKAAEADFDVMTAEPHHTGSPYQIKLADYVADQFKQFGIEATRYEYSVL